MGSSSPEEIPRVEATGVTGIGEIRSGDRLGELIARASAAQGTPLQAGDVLVVTQKIVSKAEDRVVDLNDVEVSDLARQTAAQAGRDPRLVELVLSESRAIVRSDPERGIMICETRHGFVCANAGIDASNVPGDDLVTLLPEDPDRSARRILNEVVGETAMTQLAVIVSDTFGRAWREGHVNFAVGVAGMDPMLDYRGTPDAYGATLKVTTIAAADELAAMAELVTGKSSGVPAAVIRGYRYSQGRGGVGGLLRDRATDLFR